MFGRPPRGKHAGPSPYDTRIAPCVQTPRRARRVNNNGTCVERADVGDDDGRTFKLHSAAAHECVTYLYRNNRDVMYTMINIILWCTRDTTDFRRRPGRGAENFPSTWPEWRGRRMREGRDEWFYFDVDRAHCCCNVVFCTACIIVIRPSVYDYRVTSDVRFPGPSSHHPEKKQFLLDFFKETWYWSSSEKKIIIKKITQSTPESD